MVHMSTSGRAGRTVKSRWDHERPNMAGKIRDIKSDFAMTFEKVLSQFAVIVRKFSNEVVWPLSALDCSIYWWLWSGHCDVWLSCDGFIKQCCPNVIWIK
jgi:hypothetical protein